MTLTFTDTFTNLYNPFFMGTDLKVADLLEIDINCRTGENKGIDNSLKVKNPLAVQGIVR